VIKWRRIKFTGHVAGMGETSAYRILVRNPEEKRPLGRPRREWEDNIKMDILRKCDGGIDWIDLAPDRDRWRALVNAVMNPWASINAGNFLTT
jgi:hypothetical protein